MFVSVERLQPALLLLGEKLLSRPPSHKPVMSMVNNWSFVGPGKCSGRVLQYRILIRFPLYVRPSIY